MAAATGRGSSCGSSSSGQRIKLTASKDWNKGVLCLNCELQQHQLQAAWAAGAEAAATPRQRQRAAVVLVAAAAAAAALQQQQHCSSRTTAIGKTWALNVHHRDTTVLAAVEATAVPVCAPLSVMAQFCPLSAHRSEAKLNDARSLLLLLPLLLQCCCPCHHSCCHAAAVAVTAILSTYGTCCYYGDVMFSIGSYQSKCEIEKKGEGRERGPRRGKDKKEEKTLGMMESETMNQPERRC